MIQKAIQFATKKHENQKRKFANTPYIIHPISVAKIVEKNKKSHKIKELITAALLHDTLEDTNTTEQELKKNFGELVSSLVKELTTDKNNKSGKKEYLTNKMSDSNKMSNWALVIKLADRLDNVSDFDNSSKEFKKRYTDETNFILKGIENKRQLSQTQKKLIKQIKEKLK